MGQNEGLEKRLAELEARVAALESQATSPRESPAPAQDRNDPAGIVCIRVANKRFQPQDPNQGQYQDHIWVDCTFRAVAITRPARAVKGTIEFCDLFGDPRFRIGHTINDRLAPGASVSQSGLGFEYNQFIPEHQWMLGTDLNDMTVRFRVAQILYEDGAIDTLA